ncbi:MAG: VWA domain-containing protein [Desulfobacteraceae bacterium]|nr:MAG: VWA domain-containing protein [Desulfobacteraceae bacterium]
MIESICQGGFDSFKNDHLGSFKIADEKLHAILSSFCAGHHLLLLGPAGSGKTTFALKLPQLLGPIKVVDGCPYNCFPEDAHCPYCKRRKVNGLTNLTKTVSGAERLVRIQGSDGLVPEDLIGGINPVVALTEGLHSPDAFVPGKLFKANRGMLLVDFMDQMPERVFNTILFAAQDGEISLDANEETVRLDTLIVGTGDLGTLRLLPSGLLDCFDVFSFDYDITATEEMELAYEHINERTSGDVALNKVDVAIEICRKTREHANVSKGVSIRGSMNFAGYLPWLKKAGYRDNNELIRVASSVCLPHRIRLKMGADLVHTRGDVVENIVEDVLFPASDSDTIINLSHEDLLNFVEELSSNDVLRKPLKYGALDLLLSRLRRFPESSFARFWERAKEGLKQLYPDRAGLDMLTDDILFEVEELRIKKERKIREQREIEMRALGLTLDALEKEDIVSREGGGGWELGQKSIAFLMEALSPKIAGALLFYGVGKHATGKKLATGEGRVVGLRKYRIGDRYRDIAVKETMKNAIKEKRSILKREDIAVEIKDIRASLDVILLIDLSGTMNQLQKLWYAKQSAIALGMAAVRTGDRVGIVCFSNLSSVVSDFSRGLYSMTRKIIDLEIHENAFTNIGSGVLKTVALFSKQRRTHASRHVILISDGDATAPHPSPHKYALRQAATAIKRGITISCICVAGESSNPELMKKIAKIGHGNTYIVGGEDIGSAVLEDFMEFRS